MIRLLPEIQNRNHYDKLFRDNKYWDSAWTLLHRYCAIHSYFKNEMLISEQGNFKDLAEKVYPLELTDS